MKEIPTKSAYIHFQAVVKLLITTMVYRLMKINVPYCKFIHTMIVVYITASISMNIYEMEVVNKIVKTNQQIDNQYYRCKSMCCTITGVIFINCIVIRMRSHYGDRWSSCKCIYCDCLSFIHSLMTYFSNMATESIIRIVFQWIISLHDKFDRNNQSHGNMHCGLVDYSLTLMIDVVRTVCSFYVVRRNSFLVTHGS